MVVAGSPATDSTELLIEGSGSWTQADPLPIAAGELATVSLNNAIFAIGDKITDTNINVSKLKNGGGQIRGQLLKSSKFLNLVWESIYRCK